MLPLNHIAKTLLSGVLIGVSEEMSMGRKITALHIDASGKVVKVRALSKTARGTAFTLRQGTAERGGPGKKNLRAAVEVAIGLAIHPED